uniref:Uncharacterized protein n=1 Tax=Anguilla anguilla TaxID=7936 RepID=A0A0E9SWK5_ANGAN
MLWPFACTENAKPTSAHFVGLWLFVTQTYMLTMLLIVLLV